MAKGFSIQGNDFDTLFEAPYSSFTTTTFTGLSPACTYVSRLSSGYGDNPNAAGLYKYQSTIFDAAPRGFMPSNYKVFTKSATGGWIKIARTSTGFSVGGTNLKNGNRGSYPINRVGLIFCGGGGGASGSYYRDEEEASGWRLVENESGGGGGGGGTIAVVLYLDKYDYYLYLGSGGSGVGFGSNAYDGEDSQLRLTSSSGTQIAIAYGGKGAMSGTGGAAGGTYIATRQHGVSYNYLTRTDGGLGGNYGYYYLDVDSNGEITHRDWSSWSYDVRSGEADEVTGYFSQQNDSSIFSTRGESNYYEYTGPYYETIYGPDGGRSSMYELSTSSNYGGGGASWLFYNGYGENGKPGAAMFFY